MSRRFCGKCSAVALLDVVRCIGQCRRTFHRSCVGPSAVNFTTRAEHAENGMFWCCAECRKELFGKATKETGVWTLLPQEMLAQIWNHLDTADLLRVRQVCRRWKDAFDQTSSLFGRLKAFIRGETCDFTYEPQFTAAVTNHNTLEELHTPSCNESTFRHLENMPVFRISLAEIQADTDYSFIQTHRDTLEDIQIGWITDCEILVWIGRVCPHLKRISAVIPAAPDDALASFLPTMPQLQYLKLGGFAEPEPELEPEFVNVYNHVHAPIVFENLRSPHLKELVLHDFYCYGIAEYLCNSPNIQQIRLQYCAVDNWPNFLRAIEHCHGTLEHLTLNDFDHDVKEFHLITKTLHKLNFLSFGVWNYPKESLLNIVAVCPRLEVVKFKKVKSLDDKVILALLLRAKGLRELTVLECNRVTTISAMHVLQHGTKLTQLRIDGIKIPAQLLTQLTNTRITVLN